MSHVVRCALLSALAAAAACGDNLGRQAGDGGPGQGTDADAGVEPDGGGSLACPADLDPGVLDRGSWDPRFTIAGFTGHDGTAPVVYDTARDVDGSLLAAGDFQWLGSQRVEPLLRLTGTGWAPARETWELPLPPAGFASVAVDVAGSGALALAGYDNFGERDGEIWVDDGTGLRVIGGFTGLVRAVEWYRGQLWVAGVFELTSGGDTIQSLAVWDGAAWSPPPGGPADSTVYELVLDGDRLLVGGGFGSVGGIPAAMVAAYDGAIGAWEALDLDVVPAAAVFALARDESGALHAGGAFGDVPGGHSGVARLDGDSWSLLGGGVAQYALGGVVTDLLAVGDSVYVAGCFNSAGGPTGEPDTTPAVSLARWDGSAWGAFGDNDKLVLSAWIRPNVCGDEGPLALWDAEVQTLAADGDGVLVGGQFAGLDGVQSQAVIRGSDGGWSAQGPSGLGVAGPVERVAAGGPDCAVHALGFFSHAAGERVDTNLLRFDGDRWTVEADRLPQELYCPSLAVSASGDALVGCLGPPDEDGTGGGALLRPVNGAWERIAAADALGPINAVEVGADGAIWIAGGTPTGDGGYLARFTGDDLAAVEIVEDGFDLPVYLIDPTDDGVLVAGDFTRVGDVVASRVARLAGGTWSALGAGVPSFATALAHDGDRVYISTLDAGGAGGYLLGEFDGTAWTERATAEAGMTAQPSSSFNAMRKIGGVWVLVGSAVLDEGDARGALVWDGERFSGLAGGVHGIVVTDLALAGDALWISGAVAEAGTGDTLVPTVGIARLALPTR